MKKAQVKIGGRYVAKVSNERTTVRITGESPYGGWDAVNEKSGKRVRIKSAARLHRPAMSPEEYKAMMQRLVYGPLSKLATIRECAAGNAIDLGANP